MRIARPPISMSLWNDSLSFSSIVAWCAGFLWNVSMFAPSMLDASKPGRSARKSASASSNNVNAERLA